MADAFGTIFGWPGGRGGGGGGGGGFLTTHCQKKIPRGTAGSRTTTISAIRNFVSNLLALGIVRADHYRAGGGASRIRGDFNAGPVMVKVPLLIFFNWLSFLFRFPIGGNYVGTRGTECVEFAFRDLTCLSDFYAHCG